MSLVFLSHTWGPSCPPYGGSPDKIQLTTERSIACGDTSNTLRFAAVNHIGTHMDFPRHFAEHGQVATDFAPEFFCHRAVAISWFDASESMLLSSSVVKEHLIYPKGKENDVSLLLIRTGFSRRRHESVYWEKGPGLDTGLAASLRELFPNLKMLGIDTISITAFQRRELGRAVHREFLLGASPVLLVEDMDLEPLKNQLPTQISCVPLRIENGDGAPCTVIAEIQK